MAIGKKSPIAIIEEARAAHLEWITYLRKRPDGGDVCEPVETAGNIDHHQRWIENYDVVLKALRAPPC